MTDKMAGEIIERVYISKKVTLPQLKQVRHSLSYSYYLMTGISEDNWPEVHAQWESFDPLTLPSPQKRLKAVRIPVPDNLKTAFTKQWTPQHPLSLVNFVTSALAAHDYFIFGCRPRVDLGKVKSSTSHIINVNERYGCTAMKNGRSKLQGNKKGSRPWNVYRVCFCRNCKHTSPPKRIRLNRDGNPPGQVRWNTVCPLAMMEFLQNLQGTPEFRPFVKWNDSGTVSKQNHYDLPALANIWIQNQTHLAPFDPNSGRKSLARWLEHLNVPYGVGFEIHGDLLVTWRTSYQPSTPKYIKFVDRCQSKDVDTATRALRTFAKWLHQDQPKPSIKQQLQTMLANLDD